MRKISVLLMCLLVMPFVCSEELFSGSVQDGEYFKAGDYDCHVKYSQNSEKLLFEVGERGRILALSECTEIEDLKVCYDAVDYPSITVSVYDLSPAVSIERSFSDTSFYLGETIEIEATIKNEGDKPAYDVVFTDDFPVELMVVSGSRQGNSIRWTGKLNAGVSETLKYKLQAIGVTTYASKASLSYQFSGETKKKTSSEELIEVVKPYTFTTGLSSESPRKGDVILFNLTIDNSNGNDKLEVDNLVIELSKHVEIMDFSKGLEKKDNKLYYSGTVAKEKTGVFSVHVKSLRVGEHSIKAEADLKLGTVGFREESVKNFGIGVSKISALINVTPKIVTSGDDISFKAYLKNTADKEIKSINSRVESDLFGAIDALNEKVYQGTTKEIATKTIVAPDVEEETNYKIKVIGSYSDGQTFTFKAQEEVIVQPKPRIIELLHQLNKGEFNLGDEVKVDVSIVNLKNVGLDKVSLIEILPNEIKSSLKGTITDDITVGANQKKRVYSYSFKIPGDYDKDTLDIKTIVNTNFEGSLYKHEATKQLNITETEEPTTEEVSSGEAIPESDKNLEGGAQEQKTEEKVNFLKKIINFFKNLFSRSQPEEQE